MDHQTERIVVRDDGFGEHKTLIIPEGVTKIEAYAYAGRDDFTHVSIPNSVTEIGDAAFTGCMSLQSPSLPKTVEKIGRGAYKNCPALRTPVFPERFRNEIDAIFDGNAPEDVQYK